LPSPSSKPNVDSTVAPDNLKRTFQLRTLKQIPLKVGSAHIKVWLMDESLKREEGMMWLTEKDVKADEGMLFVFDHPQELSFWMQNTLIPLDLMFVDANKNIINIAQGKALDTSPIPAERVGEYVIEMKKGSAQRLHINKGDKVGIPANVVSKDSTP
jgi:uncharacterized membrane protein (UPF0127 family)